MSADLTRAEVEDFLFHEAALLDDWRLEDWFALFVPGAIYEVPTAGAAQTADSSAVLFYVADDYMRLRYRVDRLLDPGAHSEQPRSHGTRVISNVRILGREGEETTAASVFVTYRNKADRTDVYFGHHRHRLVTIDGALRIAAKRSTLTMSSLRPQGRLSIIV